MALWADILGVVLAVGALRWVERFIGMRWPNSWIGKFFSPPPPFAVGSSEYRLLESMALATEDRVILLDDIQNQLTDNVILMDDIQTLLTTLVEKGLPGTRP
jgi:hypothetical protein